MTNLEAGVVAVLSMVGIFWFLGWIYHAGYQEGVLEGHRQHETMCPPVTDDFKGVG